MPIVLRQPLLKLSALLFAASLAAGCSNYHYKDYQGEWVPETMTPYDLSGNAADAPVVYFKTTQFRGLGVPFHRFLLATHVDDQLLEGAGRRSILDVSGKQALRLTPGKHSLNWCWVSMNALGTGGARCSFSARDVEFAAGQRYVVDFSDHDYVSGVQGRESLHIDTRTFIRNLDTQEVVYPRDGVEGELQSSN